MIKSKKLVKFKNISHGFFNRKGGVSKGIYKSLNCGLGSDDKVKNIRKNLEKVCKKIGCNRSNLVLMNQIHSNIVHKLSKIPKTYFFSVFIKIIFQIRDKFLIPSEIKLV